MKIITIIGARPQFIKAAAISRLFRQHKQCTEILVHTGQHYDSNMSEIFFNELELATPDYHLAIGSGSHGLQTGKMLEAIEKVYFQEQPDWVLIYGDTNSTVAGALAAAKCHIPVAHVEAGLRSFNRKMPEEINRVVSDQLSSLLFAPTQSDVAHLKQEGVAADKIHCVGDVMYDVAKYFGVKSDKQSHLLSQLALTPKNYILATVHRAENTDDLTRLKNIFDGLALVAKEMKVILPLHPRTRQILQKNKWLDQFSSAIHFIEPVGFLDMIQLEKNAKLIATDSGGVQKEAFFHKVPCVTLRDETEWTDLLSLGWNCIVAPTNDRHIAKMILQRAETQGDLNAEPYGKGDSADKIVDILLSSNV